MCESAVDTTQSGGYSRRSMSPTDPDTPAEPEFTVERYLSGVRIDSFLAKHLRNYTKWRLNRMIGAGLADVNGLPADQTHRVSRGQTVRIRLVEPPDKLLDPDPAEVRILYEDPWLMVVDKPAGMVAHPVGEFQSGTLANLLQHHLDQQTTCRGLMRPGIVHRLDRMTSGLMVVTKEHHAHRLVSKDFQAGRMEKFYLALVEGRVPFDERVIELPIGHRVGGRSVLMSAGAGAIRPRSARTKVTVLDRRGSITVVECRLDTGRNHQIRVHMAEIGHPVVGDEFYGPHGEIRSRPHDEGGSPTSRRHVLHAARIEFRHPILNEPLRAVSRPPDDFLGQL
jgi:23S rRNA pseudouridine1911/1915/1917 synthase